MAFPTNATVIDNFNRASLGANWINNWFGDNDFEMYNSVSIRSSVNGWGGALYSAATYGPDCEHYYDIVAYNAWGDIRITARLTDTTDSPDGYEVRLRPIAAGTCSIRRYDNGVSTQLGATFQTDLVTGDKVGIEVIGSSPNIIITAYRYGGSAWASLASRSGQTGYDAAGYFAVEIENQGPILDNMSGGTVVTGGGSAWGARRALLGIGR